MSGGEISLFTPLLAIGFGLLSFVSPCCLPLLPAYLGMIAGSATSADRSSGRWRLWWNGLAFVAGLALTFALLGATATAFGSLVLFNRQILMQIGGVLVVIFGLQMIGILHLGWLARELRLADPGQFAAHRGPLGAFLIGVTFSIGWTPCIGLFLGSLLTMAAQEDTVLVGAILLLFYGLGLGVPFLIAGVAADRALSVSRGLRAHLRTIERVGGVVLVGMGVLLFTGQLTAINVWAIRTFGLGLTF